MDYSCQDKRVLITAAASGIGRVIAETMVAAGARVHLCDIDQPALTALQLAQPAISTTVTDVSDPAQVDQLFAEATAHLGGLDMLINNAGIAGPTGPVETLTLADWERTMAININGQFLCVRQAVPLLKASGGGLIVNLASAAGIFGFPNRTPYAASKWAVVGFTKSLAMELGPHNIRVNAICPGLVEGERIDRVIAAKAEAEGRSLPETRDQITQQNSMHTFVTAQDVANMILFLASAAGNKISGQALSIDGNTETLRT